MPDELGDTRRRLDVVEQRLDAVESRMNSEAGLRAMMDHDQATLTARFDAQDHLLRALAVTQSEHGTQLRKLTIEQTRLAEEQTRLAEEQTRMAEEQTRMAEEQSRMAEEQSRMAGEQSRTTSTIARVEAGVRTIIELLERNG